MKESNFFLKQIRVLNKKTSQLKRKLHKELERNFNMLKKTFFPGISPSLRMLIMMKKLMKINANLRFKNNMRVLF